VHQHVQGRQYQDDGIADEMPPGRRLLAHQAVSQKVGQPRNRGESAHDDADRDEPGGKIRPHHFRSPPVGQIGKEGADEARNGTKAPAWDGSGARRSARSGKAWETCTG
jgi:hypothetical protein